MIAIPNCPYCEQPLDGPTINGLHEQCNDQLNQELAQWEETMEFSGVLTWRDSEGHVGTIGEFKNVQAEDRETAEQIIIEEYWDDRLDCAGCVPVINFIVEESFL